ncbi:MAG TPA: DUF58 domain-containing protein [candidate division Zixibacteria bacterium]|nr:DUF58 domain-containing protein [candidate division Zixibacteria bacterium]MDM7973468.1 DUF58 domain-containing protein [candidate division Zixibacteria bacterium]HPM36804.1 DUF58 domain-containing protein [candidate division Zixibacteria bacterium]
MTTDYRKYLDPETVSKLKGMEMRARMVVEGFIAGLHKSPYHGFSVEFAEHRQYMPGDNIRAIDWKVYAKSDRFYIKQYEEETNLKAYLLLDCSASMAYHSGERIRKLDYAGLLCGALSYLMLRQRDAVGLVTYDRKIRRYIPPRSRSGHLHVLLNEIAAQAPSDTTDISSTLHEMADRIKRRGLVIILSDLIDEADKLISGLKHFRYNNHEVIVFHILDPRERDFAFPREAVFKDMETGEELTTLPYQIKKDYAKAVAAFSSEIASACRQAAIDYHPIDTAMPFDKALYAFLSKRERLY